MENENLPITAANTVFQADASAAEVLESHAPALSKRPKNALTHGVYAEEIVLEWENPDDLIKLRENMWAELQPEGSLEKETVAGIVHDVWLKHRLMRTVNLGYRRDPFGAAVAGAAPKDWNELARMITTTADNKDNLATELRDSLNALENAAKKIDDLNMTVFMLNSQGDLSKEAFAEVQQTKSKVDLVLELFTKQVFRRMTDLEDAHKSSAVTGFENAYSHEHLEKALRLEAMLDTRIDKQMARLVNLKEYKRLRSMQLKDISNGPSIVALPLENAQHDIATDKSNVKKVRSRRKRSRRS